MPRARVAAGFVLFVHLALSPLVFSYATTEHFELNKVALLLLTVALLVGLGAVELPIRSWRRDPLSLGVVLFAGSALVSSVVSISPRTSLVGYPDSFAGLPTVLACAGLFFATRGACRSPDAARRLLLAPVFGAALVAAYAALQFLGLDPMPWTHAASFAERVRPFSTLSHPNFLGAYLAMALPLGGVLGLRARGLARAAFVIAGVLGVLVIASSLSRAAWAALGVALGVLGLGALRLGRRKRVLRWGVGLAVGLGLLVGLSLVLPEGAELRALVSERTRTLTDPGARHFIWRAAWHIFLEHPLLGCGLDGFALAFQRHREPAYWLLEWATTPYRAHSDLLHVLATQGLVGAGAVAVMMVGLGHSGLKAWRQARREDQPLVLALVAGLAAFCVQGLVGFTVTATAVLFFTFAGVLSGLCAQGSEGSEDRGSESLAPALWSSAVLSLGVFTFNFLGGPWEPDPTRPGPSIALLVLASSAVGMIAGVSSVASPPDGSRAAAPLRPARRAWVRVAAWAGCLGVAYWLVLRPYRASLAAHEGDLLLLSAPEQAVALYTHATELDPTRDFYFVRLGTALEQAASRTADPAERTHQLSRALEAFQRAVSLVPADARHRADLGSMLAEFAALKMATPSQVYAAFDEALARDPYDATVHVRAANAALRLGDNPMAQRYASRAAELYPRFAPPRAQLGYLALTAGHPEDAVRLLREALEGDWYDDDAAETAASGNLAAALLAQGHTGEAIAEYRRLLALQPDYLPAREALRKLGADAGQP